MVPVFDEQTVPNTQAWPLSDLIKGWVIGIPLIRKAGISNLLFLLPWPMDANNIIPFPAILYFISILT